MDKRQANILLVENQEVHIELICRTFEAHNNHLTLTIARNLHQAKTHLCNSSHRQRR